MGVDDQRVFFSYSRSDSEFALRLAGDMRSAGVDLWIDQLDIPTGARWDQAVEDAVRACPRLLIILSPASVASQNVMDEVAFAIDENKNVLPVLYRPCDVPLRLRRLQNIPFTDDYDTALTKLLTALAARPRDDRRATLPTTSHYLQRIATRRMAIILSIILVGGTLGWAFWAQRDQVFRRSAHSPEWMTSEQYQEAFDRQVKDGLYPHKLEGRCVSGSEKFLVEWKGFPLGSEGFLSHHDVTREFYERKNQEYTSMGASLESLNSFKDCAGNDKYQANWFKRKPESQRHRPGSAVGHNSRGSVAAPAVRIKPERSGRLRRRAHDVEDDVEDGPLALVVIVIVVMAVALLSESQHHVELARAEVIRLYAGRVLRPWVKIGEPAYNPPRVSRPRHETSRGGPHMPAYFIVDNEVIDHAGFDEYRRQVPATLEKYGGKILVRGGQLQTLEGDWKPKRIVVTEFPSLEQARRWYDSEEYRPLKALRLRTARGSIVLVEGV